MGFKSKVCKVQVCYEGSAMLCSQLLQVIALTRHTMIATVRQTTTNTLPDFRNADFWSGALPTTRIGRIATLAQ